MVLYLAPISDVKQRAMVQHFVLSINFYSSLWRRVRSLGRPNDATVEMRIKFFKSNQEKKRWASDAIDMGDEMAERLNATDELIKS